ncbi:MAG: hypothetical protein ACFCUR_03945 [Rhodomicrobiaceae bacterium]
MQQEISKEDARLLAGVGFLAWSYSNLEAALAIFKGVEAARSQSKAGLLGIALTHLARGEAGAAVTTPRTLPPSDPAQLHLTIALLKSSDKPAADESVRRSRECGQRHALRGHRRGASERPAGQYADPPDGVNADHP